MEEDFIRYYIGDIHLSMLKTVQRESGKFNEWELMQGSEFDYKNSYGYQEDPPRDDSLLEVLAKRSIIAETRQPASVKSSILWLKASNIADVLTLLSLARVRHHFPLAIETKLGTGYGVHLGLMPREITGNWGIVSISNLGGFISEALTFIENNPSWLEESGFTPSIYWHQQAQMIYPTAPSILEMGLYWVSLEALANTYIEAQRIDVPYKKERVKRFITDRGYTGKDWDFLGEAVDGWYIARNDAFHEGKEKLPIELLIKRRQQLRDFTSLVLVDMLQQQDEAKKTEIATRMRKY